MTKPTKNSWYCHNGERRKRGLENLSWEEYLEYYRQHDLDSIGRITPKRTSSIGKMFKTLGMAIFNKKKICIDCGCKKPLKDFTYTPERRGKSYVEAWCRDCNAIRQERYRE